MNRVIFTLKELPSDCYSCPFKIMGHFEAYCGIHPNILKEKQDLPKKGFRDDCPLRTTEFLDISEDVSSLYLREITVHKHWWEG